MRECECGCGRVIPHRKSGHREREYYSDACRKRAWRRRNKWKHDLQRLWREAEERLAISVEQDVYRESWQDDLKRKDETLDSLRKQLKREHWEADLLEVQNNALQLELELLRERLADREAEIVRLQVLLEASSKKRSR